jgi:hypothetical protein
MAASSSSGLDAGEHLPDRLGPNAPRLVDCGQRSSPQRRVPNPKAATEREALPSAEGADMALRLVAGEIAPEEQSRGREESPLVVSPQNIGTASDQTAPLATVGANSSASSAAPILQAVAQLSETMIMLTEAGELGLREPFTRRSVSCLFRATVRRQSAPSQRTRERGDSGAGERSAGRVQG